MGLRVQAPPGEQHRFTHRSSLGRVHDGERQRRSGLWGVTSSLRGVRYVDGDEGYDIDDPYVMSRERGFDLAAR